MAGSAAFSVVIRRRMVIHHGDQKLFFSTSDSKRSAKQRLYDKPHHASRVPAPKLESWPGIGDLDNAEEWYRRGHGVGLNEPDISTTTARCGNSGGSTPKPAGPR